MRSEGSYSHTGNKGQVPNFEFHRRARSKGVSVSEDVTVNSIVGLMTILSQQPCSVAIEDDSLSFQLYAGGILQFWCGTNLDHDGLPSVVSRQQGGLYGSPQEHLWKDHLWKGAESFNGHVHFICSSNALISPGLQNSEFMSQYTRYKPDYVRSGLKQLGTCAYVGQPQLGALDWTTK